MFEKRELQNTSGTRSRESQRQRQSATALDPREASRLSVVRSAIHISPKSQDSNVKKKQNVPSPPTGINQSPYGMSALPSCLLVCTPSRSFFHALLGLGKETRYPRSTDLAVSFSGFREQGSIQLSSGEEPKVKLNIRGDIICPKCCLFTTVEPIKYGYRG